jgi:phosphoribosylamine--glycine ligase
MDARAVSGISMPPVEISALFTGKMQQSAPPAPLTSVEKQSILPLWRTCHARKRFPRVCGIAHQDISPPYHNQLEYNSVRILIIGSGGREHALAWKLNQSPLKPELFIAPGNGGTALEGENIPVSETDIQGLMNVIVEKRIDFVIPGPELPLVNGIVDACETIGVRSFGPAAYAANLEGSKAFAKTIMREAGVPTADFAVFRDYAAAVSYVRSRPLPLVIKADGLAAGKGVIIAHSLEEALAALNLYMNERVFGVAGECVVVEDCLIGEEASFLAFCQGDTVLPMPSAQDHKAAYDGDTGPNTGGMGAYSPAPILPESRYPEIVDLVFRPMLAAMKARGCPFSGILYAGLMMTSEGPKVLEFNVRFGDPECQPLLMRLESDLLEVMLACAEGRLADCSLSFSKQTGLCVVLTAKGYPTAYPRGMVIEGISRAEATAPGNVKVFQAGTKLDGRQLISTGGRVLGVTALGDSLAQAQQRAYAAVGHIHMTNCHFRRDIGNKGMRV